MRANFFAHVDPADLPALNAAFGRLHEAQHGAGARPAAPGPVDVEDARRAARAAGPVTGPVR